MFATFDHLLPSPLLKVSLPWHVAMLGMWGWHPRLWPWAVGGLVLNHVLLAWGGLWPRSQLLGPNLLRLDGDSDRVAITIDDGPNPRITPRVLDLLAARGARATFFCIGQQVERHPELARRILREGHEIANHSQRHSHTFSVSGPGTLRRELERSQASFERVCGVRPRWFRAPAGLRNLFLQPQLARLGLQLTSWTRRGFDTVKGDPERVLQSLLRDLRGGDILLLHDGQVAYTPRGEPVIMEVLPELLARLRARNLRCVTLSEGMTEY